MAAVFFQSVFLDGNGDKIETADGILCNVVRDGEESVIVISRQTLVESGILEESDNSDIEQSPTTNANAPEVTKCDNEWGSADTKILLDKYEQYLGEVGPLKKFKNKKCMWAKISSDIKDIINIERTAAQCANRYKTILKRKVKIDSENRTSGSTRVETEYEEEVNKIKAIDDSLEPEVLMSVGENNRKIKQPAGCSSSQASSRPEKKQRRDSLAETLNKINEAKEANRERRHAEKMALIQKLFEKKKE